MSLNDYMNIMHVLTLGLTVLVGEKQDMALQADGNYQHVLTFIQLPLGWKQVAQFPLNAFGVRDAYSSLIAEVVNA